MTREICDFDFEDAHYLGGQCNGVYFSAAQGKDGKWYMSATVDAKLFTESLVDDDGPYETCEEACKAGLDTAVGWCTKNVVVVDNSEIDKLHDVIQTG